MSGMHLLPVYYTTTSTKRRKRRNKTKSLLAAEKEHEKFLKKMGVGKSKGGRSSVGRAPALQAGGQEFDSPRLHQKPDTSGWGPCTKKDESYKLGISDRYVVGQAYNKGGLQVLSKREQNDPATGKRR